MCKHQNTQQPCSLLPINKECGSAGTFQPGCQLSLSGVYEILPEVAFALENYKRLD